MNAAQNAIDASKANELDEVTRDERVLRAKRDSYASQSSWTMTAARATLAVAEGYVRVAGGGHLMNQQMAKYSIVKAGADLEVANHGLEAVELIKKRLSEGTRNYDCVLMDMMMPVMTAGGDARNTKAREDLASKRPEAARDRRFERERRTGVHEQGEIGGHERLDVEAVLPGDTESHARERHERDVPGLRARLGGRKRQRAPQAGELARFIARASARACTRA